jgi:hypothetical protein
VQNPDARRRAIVAALIAVGVIAVLAIAIRSRGGDDNPPAPTAIVENIDSNATFPPTVEGGVELGSLQISAFSCAERSTPDSECMNAGSVDLTAFSMTLPDGQTISLENAQQMEDGSYQWLNIPIGTYTLPKANVAGPAGLEVRNIAGPAEPTADGWTISNADPNQPAVINILYAPAEGSPAAG